MNQISSSIRLYSALTKQYLNTQNVLAIPSFVLHHYFSNKNLESNVCKSVLISQSRDIFSNLALEEWIYRNVDLGRSHALVMWQNDPCIVIGKHQNPWLETDFWNENITFARRNSGGGTVYHDHGNLNLTFFTDRESYNRKNNLEVITKVLSVEWGLEAKINKREDIVVEGELKFSGTASKLGRPNAYHHCTLLVDVDLVRLRGALQTRAARIFTRATRSVPSAVVNLSQLNDQVNVDKLVSSIGLEYLQSDRFIRVTPVEQDFPGIDRIRSEFSSWEWRCGKTPSFSIAWVFAVAGQQLAVTLHVMGGVVRDASVEGPSGTVAEESSLLSVLRGCRFSKDCVLSLQRILSEATQQNDLKLYLKSE